VPFNALLKPSDRLKKGARGQHGEEAGRAIGHEMCREGKRGRLLQPPTAEAYLELLGPLARPPAAAVVGLGLRTPARAAGDPAPVVDYETLERALRAAAASTVVYLPSRLTVRPESVPTAVLQRLETYCTLTAAAEPAAAQERKN
jgi:hypothetical protein